MVVEVRSEKGDERAFRRCPEKNMLHIRILDSQRDNKQLTDSWGAISSNTGMRAEAPLDILTGDGEDRPISNVHNPRSEREEGSEGGQAYSLMETDLQKSTDSQFYIP